MKKYVLYDNKTGEILHTHQSYKLGSDELEKISDKELEEITSRFEEPEKIKIAMIDEPYQSSRLFVKKVDIKTSKILVTQIKEK